MKARLPIIEQLDDMTDIERADWLQKLPFALLVKHQGEIAGAFDRLGFPAGTRCLESELALLASVRAADGVFRQEPLMAAHIARSEMRAAAKRG